MTKRELTAYLAGLCDGEAYFGIKKSGANHAVTGRVNPAYHERIQVRMVDEPAIKLLSETFGGSYYKEKPHAAKGRLLYCYQASDISAANILRALMPYLRVKRAVAQRVLALRVLKDNPLRVTLQTEIMGRWGKPIKLGRGRYSDEHIAACESLWLECKSLNRVGV